MDAKLKIIKYDDLTVKSKDVEKEEFGEALDIFMSEMISEMYFEKGIGLAGVQVGRLDRILVLDTGIGTGEKYGSSSLKMVNPVITARAEVVEVEKEGCLTYPGYVQSVKRSSSVEVRFKTPYGEDFTEVFSGVLARIIQHEIDHFDGVTIFSKGSLMKRRRYIKKVEKAMEKIS